MKRILLALLLLLVPVATQAATRTSIATDNFNRAAPLGADWTQLNITLGGSVSIGSSTVYGGASGGQPVNGATAVWSGAGTFSNDQYSSAVFVETDFGSENYRIGVICRASTDTNANRDYYYHSAGSNNVSILGKIVNGTNTAIHTASVTWDDGDRVELECEGTTIRAMKSGVALGGSFTATDTALTTGKPGITANGDSFVATGDDWEGGDLSAAATPTFFYRRRGEGL